MELSGKLTVGDFTAYTNWAFQRQHAHTFVSNQSLFAPDQPAYVATHWINTDHSEATVGSAGPFIGLFGTVWGIMTSFQSIAASKNTSLAVVAPGIAEALFATAIGLVAAIPATIFYNKFSSEVNKQAQRLEGFADEFSAILSRQIDERA